MRVAAKDLDGDARADLVAGIGEGGSRAAGYASSSHAGGPPAEASGFDASPGTADGVFVGRGRPAGRAIGRGR